MRVRRIADMLQEGGIMGRTDFLRPAIDRLHEAGLVPTFTRIAVAQLLLEYRAGDVDELVDRALQDDLLLCATAVATALECFALAGLLPVLLADARGRP